MSSANKSTGQTIPPAMLAKAGDMVMDALREAGIDTNGMEVKSIRSMKAATGEGAHTLEWKPNDYLTSQYGGSAETSSKRVTALFFISSESYNVYMPAFRPSELPMALGLTEDPRPSDSIVRDRFFALAPTCFRPMPTDAGSIILIKPNVPYYIEANKSSQERIWIEVVVE